jgi:hypothetical protein
MKLWVSAQYLTQERTDFLHTFVHRAGVCYSYTQRLSTWESRAVARGKQRVPEVNTIVHLVGMGDLWPIILQHFAALAVRVDTPVSS